MDVSAHWERIYSTKEPDAVSWYLPHLDMSLALVERASGGRSASIIDVGGESTLLDDLQERGYRDVTVLDISRTAIEVTKKRLGAAAEQVHGIASEVTRASLACESYYVWHDRAVFHFLTEKEHRLAYVQRVFQAVKPGGYVIVSTFGPAPSEMQRARRGAIRLVRSAPAIRQTIQLAGQR